MNLKLKIISISCLFIFLTNCTYKMHFGKACTPGNSEWSYVWLQEKGEVNVSKENCRK